MLDRKPKNICEKRLLLSKRVVRLIYTLVYFVISFIMFHFVYQKRYTKKERLNTLAILNDITMIVILYCNNVINNFAAK